MIPGRAPQAPRPPGDLRDFAVPPATDPAPADPESSTTLAVTEPIVVGDGVPAPTRLDRYCAPVMFVVTVVFIIVLGMVLHLMVGEAVEPYAPLVRWCEVVLVALLPVYLAEAWLHARSGTPRWRRDLVFCLFPPARLAGRDHASGQLVWLPGLGWRKADDDLAVLVERKLSMPMIGVALLVLPLLALEFHFQDKGTVPKGWELGLRLSSAAIWTLFTMEFLVMITIVRKKILYIKNHWIDLAIILLPLVEYLRALRIGRLLRLNQLTKLGRTARVFRMRGLLMRSWRAVLLLGVVQRLIHRTPQRQLESLRETIREREEELADLRERAVAVEQQIAALERSPATEPLIIQATPDQSRT